MPLADSVLLKVWKVLIGQLTICLSNKEKFSEVEGKVLFEVATFVTIIWLVSMFGEIMTTFTKSCTISKTAWKGQIEIKGCEDTCHYYHYFSLFLYVLYSKQFKTTICGISTIVSSYSANTLLKQCVLCTPYWWLPFLNNIITLQ